jgi:hypothetical protein
MAPSPRHRGTGPGAAIICVFYTPSLFKVLGGLGKNTDQIPRISGAHHFLSRIIGIKFPEFMPAAQRHLSKIWPFLPWRKLENQVEVFLLAF